MWSRIRPGRAAVSFDGEDDSEEEEDGRLVVYSHRSADARPVLVDGSVEKVVVSSVWPGFGR